MSDTNSQRRASGTQRTGASRLAKGTEGAVLVEFMVVFFPLFGFFLGLVQFMFIQAANLVVGHSAQVAARAAMVVIPEGQSGTPNPVTGKALGEITRAARMPLATLGVSAGDVGVKLNRGSYGRDDAIVVTVTVDFPCRVPLGSLIACGGAKKTLTATGTMPNQGVEWYY